MTSHYRHRRITNPATAFPANLEPGEIATNTANRQIAVGDAAAGAGGAPLILIAVRAFDARAQYAIGDFVVQAGQLYRAKVAITPAAFNASQWDVYSSDAVLKQYVDDADAAIRTDFAAADTFLQTQLNGRVAKTGDTMSGPLGLPGAPTLDAQAANKKYVDDAIASIPGGGGGGASTAAAVSYTPTGNIQATDVQAALTELDNEKAKIASPAFTGNPTAPTPPPDDNSLKLANTAWFANQGASEIPQPPGAANYGSSPHWARADHVHPHDTAAGAPLDSPAFTGTPTAPTAPVGTNTDQIATTKFVMTQPAQSIANLTVSYPKLDTTIVASGADFRANVANKILTPNTVWDAAPPVNISEQTGPPPYAEPDFGAGIDFIWTLGGVDRDLKTPIRIKVGQKGVIYLKQPAAGGATIKNWGSVYKFPNNGLKPTLTATANALDVLTYLVKSPTEIECTHIANFA